MRGTGGTQVGYERLTGCDIPDVGKVDEGHSCSSQVGWGEERQSCTTLILAGNHRDKLKFLEHLKISRNTSTVVHSESPERRGAGPQPPRPPNSAEGSHGPAQ
eukprot:767722-Hanusia_phi.AAC.7